MKYNILRKKLATHEILVVFLLFIISVLVRFFIANRFPLNIQCYPDELRYYHIASSIANGTGISIYNAATDFQKYYIHYFWSQLAQLAILAQKYLSFFNKLDINELRRILCLLFI